MLAPYPPEFRQRTVELARESDAWSITLHFRAEVVCEDNFDMATWKRRPDTDSAGQVHRTDYGGARYSRWIFGQQLREAGIVGSMGTVGDALTIAMAEGFLATLQTELLDCKTWTTRAKLAQATSEYIAGFYNPERRHFHVDSLSPVQHRQRHHAPISEGT